jgi:uncharacterized protein (DUF1810 family)
MAGRAERAADPFVLERFVRAQASVYAQALAELRAGRKRSHWMWFVLPQLRGLGASGTAHRYGLSGLDEARAYLAHPLLGVRLLECAGALLQVEGASAHDIFGSPDDRKLRSCATLFARACPPGSAFERVLEKYFAGEPDPATLALLARAAEGESGA